MKYCFLSLLIVITFKTTAQQTPSTIEAGATLSPAAKTFITNVTVIDVEKQQLIPQATVGITDDKITLVAAKYKQSLPTDATVIDGTGQFLLPGLTDAHIHFFQSGGLYTRPDGLDFRKYMPYEKEIDWNKKNMIDVLKRNTALGITSLVDVGATFNFLSLRDQYKGKSYAPFVYMTGPLLTTYEPAAFKDLGDDAPFSLVHSADEARAMVRAQLPHQPDFIKIWYILDDEKGKEASAREYLPIIQAIIEEAHGYQLKVAVHATERIAAQLAVESGCDYLVHSVDDEVVSDDFVRLLKSKNVTLCPTLLVGDNYYKTFGWKTDYTLYDFTHANPFQLGSLYDLQHLPDTALIFKVKTRVQKRKGEYDLADSISLINLQKLVNGGVRIAAGTDAGNPGTLHGTALLHELQAMKKSGISNWQVLQSATINPTYFLNREKIQGSITVNKIADMILLKANPVTDLQNLAKISMVINKGNVIKPDTLIKETPLALVQRQLNAYNARDIEAFLEPYADDVEIYAFPSKLLTKGKEAMRKDYSFFSQVPNLHCEIKQRIVQGNIIIDKESVTGFGPNPLLATAIYEIEGDKIRRVYFIQ